jgi:hypothetical protein
MTLDLLITIADWRLRIADYAIPNIGAPASEREVRRAIAKRIIQSG